MDAEHTSPVLPDQSPGVVAPFYRAHGLLTWSVGLLFASVGVIMSLSLASCQSGGAGTGSGGVAGRSEGSTAGTREDAAALARVPVASLSGLTSEPEMRVRLAAGITEISLGGYTGPARAGAPAQGGTVYIGPIGGRTGPMPLPGPLKVQMTAKGWLLTDGAGKAIRLEQPGELVVTADPADWTMSETVPAVEQQTGAPGAMISVAGTPYPGRLWLVPRSDLASASGGFDLIEHVGLEKYLTGVVVKEMYSHWPKEAFKVQAVCARSYALHERMRGQRSARAYDVESTTRDQAYAGASSNRNAIEAVNATRGVVLAYNGEILRSYYSSTCGGRTASAKDTWPTTRGYEYNLLAPIQAHTRDFACQDSPIFTWTVTRSSDELAKRFRAYGESQGFLIRQIKGVYGLDVLETAPTGRPSVYKVIDAGGTWYKLKAEDLRLACNTSVAGLPQITSKERVNSGDVSFKVTGGKVEITGRGFGHGVGMCQYCARAMAARGDSWQKMLGVFYEGAEVVKGYR